MASENRRLAVLIDAENATAALEVIDALMDKVETLGSATVKRIYGDFSQSGLSGRNERLLQHSIQPVHQLRNTENKNGSDIALVIDAIDLLHRGKVDGFCIVSGDSDFTGLARRIREDGLPVYGFGQKANAAKASFVPACDDFFYIDDLGTRPVAAKSPKPTATKGANRSQLPLDDLREAFESVKKDDGWALLSAFGAAIRTAIPPFKVEDYGCSNLTELLNESAYFSVKKRTDSKGNKQDWVRLKSNPGNGA